MRRPGTSTSARSLRCARNWKTCESAAISERVASAEAELDFLLREVSRAVGLGGRIRRAGAAAERARLNVTRAIKSALQKISEHHAQLGNLLDRSIRTGTFSCLSSESSKPDRVAILCWGRADRRRGSNGSGFHPARNQSRAIAGRSHDVCRQRSGTRRAAPPARANAGRRGRSRDDWRRARRGQDPNRRRVRRGSCEAGDSSRWSAVATIAKIRSRSTRSSKFLNRRWRNRRARRPSGPRSATTRRRWRA